MATYQLAGFDARDRGFSRPAEIAQTDGGYRATLRYEALQLVTDPHATPDAALRALVDTLHAQGYRQLRTQLSFRDGAYLGSREAWVEHPDPVAPPRPSGWRAWLLGWLPSRGGAA